MVSSAAESAYRGLAEQDPVLADLIRRFGRPDPFHWGWVADRPGSGAYRVLLLQIVSQHMPVARSFRLFDRLESAAGTIEPGRVGELGADGLAAAGLPSGKVSTILAATNAILNGGLDLDHLPNGDAGQAALTAIPGIGPWTAQMFLLGQAHRADVLPAGDYGIRRAVQQEWGLPAVPSPADVARRGRGWSPYRSYAAALLWTSALRVEGGIRPGDPGWGGKRAAAG